MSSLSCAERKAHNDPSFALECFVINDEELENESTGNDDG